MADVRALLKAKRQEIRVNHPFASYSTSGQLRCVACGTIVKEGSSWNGHIGSKAHRLNAARLREEEQRRQEQERQAELQRQKRTAAEVEDAEELDAKRRRTSEPEDDEEGDDEGEDEGGRASPAARPTTGFPADFFSDRARAPPPPSSDDGSGGEDAPAAPVAAPAEASAIDQEWARFQAAVVNAPDTHETYERATVMAEPVLAAETPEGFPPAEAQADAAGETRDVVDEGARRRRRELDERELIMDRLMEEEQAQEEADAKVSALKARLEALKRQRQAARAAKTKSGTQ